MATRIRGVRQGVPSGYYLGRPAGGPRGPVTLIPIAPGQGASATATSGGFTPQAQSTGGGVALNSTGAWSSSTAYNPGDVVTYNGGAYLNYVAVTAPGPNPTPDGDKTHWLSQGDVNTVDANFVISTGQLQLAAIASGDVLGNSGAGSAEPTAATLTAMIDRAFGSTEGQILQRGASAWQILAPGSAGQVLLSGGASALNSWGTDELGVATNSSAAAGYKGEVLSSTVGFGSATGLTTTVAKDITTLSITAGDWDVWGTIGFIGGATTTVTVVQGSINTSTAIGNITQSLFTDYLAGGTPFGSTAQLDYALSPQRVSIASTTTYHLVAVANFGTSTCSGFGTIVARRVR